MNTLGRVLPQATLHTSHVPYVPLSPNKNLINLLPRTLTLRLDYLSLIHFYCTINAYVLMFIKWLFFFILIRNILLGGGICGFNFFLTKNPLNSLASNGHSMLSAKICLLGNPRTPGLRSGQKQKERIRKTLQRYQDCNISKQSSSLAAIQHWDAFVA